MWSKHDDVIKFSALLAICAGNSPVTCEFRAQRPVTRSFDVFFDLRLNKRLSKQWWGWWFETPSHPLWSYCNDSDTHRSHKRGSTIIRFSFFSNPVNCWHQMHHTNRYGNHEWSERSMLLCRLLNYAEVTLRLPHLTVQTTTSQLNTGCRPRYSNE